MKKKVLFYYPSNKRSIALETIIYSLQKEGIIFSLLTTCQKGDFHRELEKNGIQAYSSNIKKANSLVYYLRQVLYLIKFTKRGKFDFVFSHLQHANFITVLAQYFFSAKCIVARHHFKFNKGYPNIPLKVDKMEVFFDWVINCLSKKIIVPSSGVYGGMKNHEKINMKKVEIIPYIYDFSSYPNPNIKNCKAIKTKYNSDLLAIMVSRLIPFKRHHLVFSTINNLVKEGLDIKLMVFDTGVEEEKLKSYIKNNNLEENIFMLGYRNNLIDYMKASDILILPSLTEASNNVVKEMGLMKKAVAVCKYVGDFDDYVRDGENGFLMDIETPEKDIEKIIRKVIRDKNILNACGERLYKDIVSRFTQNSTALNKYKKLFIK